MRADEEHLLEEDGFPPPLPPAPRRSRFHPAVTVLATLLFLGVVALAVTTEDDPYAALDDPGRAAVRVYERTLDVAEGGARGPLLDLVGVVDSSTAGAETAWREVAAHLDRQGRYGEADRVRARLVVLLGEEGRFLEAGPTLARLVRSDLDGAAAFVWCARTAYGAPGGGEAARPDDLGALPGPGWARRHLLARLEGVSTEAPPNRIRAYAWIVGAFLLLLGAGAVYGLLLLVVPRLRPRWGSAALLPPPWSLGDGYAVLVRGAALGFLVLVVCIVIALVAIGDMVPFPMDQTTLVAMCPAVWLVAVLLLRPHGAGVRAAFGLAPSARGAISLVLVGLTALAIDEAGGFGIGLLANHLGFEYHWAEGVDEGLLFGSGGRAALLTVDAVVWAPLFEEILFRGVLYATLRTRLGPAAAAITSAVLFSAAHFYSWPGFLVITWSGLVWAVAYEKTRSIGPGIVAHALHNGVLLAYLLAVLR